jgi:hypothetical protein
MNTSSSARRFGALPATAVERGVAKKHSPRPLPRQTPEPTHFLRVISSLGGGFGGFQWLSVACGGLTSKGGHTDFMPISYRFGIPEFASGHSRARPSRVNARAPFVRIREIVSAAESFRLRAAGASGAHRTLFGARDPTAVPYNTERNAGRGRVFSTGGGMNSSVGESGEPALQNPQKRA